MLSIRQIVDRAAANMFERESLCITEYWRKGGELRLTFICAAETGPCPKPCVFTAETLTLDLGTPREAARTRRRLERAALAATLE